MEMFVVLNYINSILSMWLMQYHNISINDIYRDFFPKKELFSPLVRRHFYYEICGVVLLNQCYRSDLLVSLEIIESFNNQCKHL